MQYMNMPSASAAAIAAWNDAFAQWEEEADRQRREVYAVFRQTDEPLARQSAASAYADKIATAKFAAMEAARDAEREWHEAND
ncbi:hypothetical protein [Bifidobacterium saguinibicoloris]|uniref:hypothetical protein n=1 Tax=Bifidobacterium saguinibicoloris TaxID=2834433 RepID=UPI001C579B24|nr:hypothetical protein [Bifidobacterium saguinibicoloris]MBW3080673.1 hypothetical protein [Bifidobacterium saguinibicoloris]